MSFARWTSVGAGTVAAGVGGVLIMVIAVISGVAGDDATQNQAFQTDTCAADTLTGGGGVAAPAGTQATAQWSAEQRANAATITAVGKGRGLPARAAQIAVATAIQESTLRNIEYGDRDSVGLFQQRTSQGWGSVAQIMDPVYSAGKFYDGLAKINGWQSMPLTQAAQAVQRSGFPDAYAKWETAAKDLVEAVWHDAELPAGKDAGAGSPGECVDPDSGEDTSAGGGWVAPVANSAVGAGYRVAGSSWSSGYHTGVDFPVSTGTTVRAVGPGTVVTAGWSSSYGYQVVIKHKDRVYSQYAHLSSLGVTPGQKVGAGKKVGQSGNTGNSSGPHLHFEIRTGPEYGTDIDPLKYLRSHGVRI